MAAREILARFGRLGTLPTDSDDERRTKAILTYVAAFYSLIGSVWGLTYFLVGQRLPAVFPWGYAVVVGLNLWLFFATKRYRLFRFVNLLLILWLPVLLQWSLGGFARSGAVMLWSLMAPLGSLLFQQGRQSTGWFLAFGALTVLSGFFDGISWTSTPPMPPLVVTTFACCNVGGVAAIAFLMMQLYVKEDRRVLAATRARLEAANRLASVGALAAGVAHEINNPTSAVLGNLAYLLEPLAKGEPLPADAKECLDDSFTSTKRIARIVRQLLDAGRVAAGQQGRIAPFALAPAVRSALASTRTQQHHVAVEVGIAPELHVLGDEDLLAQVVTNLVVNAAQAIAEARPSGHIVLSAARVNGSVRLTVRDDGPGIPAAAQARLFEPFFTTKRQGRGTGLGLAVSLGLMRSQGGDLRLSATSAQGTAFDVELPHAELPAETPAGGADAAPQESAPKAALRLLLVDDDAVVLEGLRRRLSPWFQVRTVDKVTGALELLAEPGAFDVVLCDISMPDGGGARLWAALNERGSGAAARLLFMTAGAVTAEARAFVAQQGSRVLLKPIEPAQLQALAWSVTRAGGHEREAPPRG